jgi:hypothetical protein
LVLDLPSPPEECTVDRPPDDLAPLSEIVQDGESDLAAPAIAARLVSREERARNPATELSRLRGTLLHRVVQRIGLAVPTEADDDMVRRLVRQLMTSEERQAVDDVVALAADVARAYRQLAGREDIRRHFEGGEVFHEVPFSMNDDGQTVRGTIDCLIRTSLDTTGATPAASDRLLVLELKTGHRRPEHEQQLALYRRAAAQLFPGAQVDASLVYLDEGH